jgi:hypothetical protein
MQSNQGLEVTERNAFEREVTYGQHALRLAVAQSSDLDEHYFLGFLQGLERAKELLAACDGGAR